MTLGELTQALVKFRDERDWAQFHTLRSLIVSLNLEASELLELTQWKSDPEIAALPENAGQMEALRDECADVLLYLLLIAEKTESRHDVFPVFLMASCYQKMGDLKFQTWL
jgi:NTP pyrophosphatase (non-canonical NTP hydrolase)